MAKELVEELIYAKQLAGEDLWRLNEAIFNVPEDDVIKHQLSSRLFQLVTRIRKEYQAGHFYARDQGDYLALLGTLQNQPFSARQSATLRQWIAEALGAGKDDFGAQDRPARADLKKLQRLTETNQVLAEELQKLKKLEKAVRIFASFQMPSGLARSREKVEPAKAANKETPEQRTVDAITEALKKAGKEKAKAQEAPGYQVHTDIGWRRYDEDAQNVIQNACTKGREECEIFAQGQYYKINLKRMVQINPGTGNEREIRLHGQRPVAPEMPKLNFKRLMVEFKQLEAQIADGSCEGFLLRCEPVEDNLMEWEVDMSFPSDSPLQKSLDNLAAIMFDSTLKRLTLCVRFTVEFPLSPPEVWLRRPRMRYPSGQTGPVTFGGRVCSLLLASAGWQPATSMLSVFKEVQQSLLASEIEANTMVHIKKEYPKASVQLERLNTELFHTVNGFCKDGMTALSPEAAQPFLGDLKRLEVTDKIGLPLSYANGIYQRAELGAELVLPMIFEIKTLLGRKTHCAIFEFFDGLPDMHVLIPKWVMEDLAIHEREPVRVRGVELDLVTSVKVQPHSVDFYSAVRDSQRDVKELLTESLSRFSTLTEDTAVPIEVNEKFFQVQVISVEPHGAVRIIDMDVQHHFEFKVEFEPAPDLEDENATKEYQDRVLNSIKLRRERSAAGRQEIEQRRSEARRKRYEDLLQKFRGGQGEGGQIEIALRMPDGSQVKGKFVEGSPVSSLVAFALESSWAKTALPWGVYLRRAFPKQVLKEDEAITKEFHRSALSIQEEQAPEKDEELFAVLRASSPQRRKPPEGAEPEALAPLPVPERDEATLMSRTQRAFEMQRFLRAGFSLEEAEEKFQAGEEVEFFDRPLTPSFRPEMLISDDEKVPPIPSALLEQQGCSKQYKSTGKLLGKGNWGTVYEVEEQGSKCRFWRRCQKKRFALKMVSASSQQGKAVMEHEAQVMLAANQHNCSHVVPMITPAPCVDGKQQHYSFVTTLLPYDLFKWRNQQTSRVKLQHCYPVVAKAVYDGLKCLHASGYIHGDLKDDNILFKEFDADGCPSGIVLGDLGLARKIGSSIYKFHASNYAGSCHLVASLFDGQSDPLGINTMVRVQGTYVNAAIVQAKIDYCSWAMMVTYIFGLPEDKDLTKMLGKGSCGPMGPGRRKLYP